MLSSYLINHQSMRTYWGGSCKSVHSEPGTSGDEWLASRLSCFTMGKETTVQIG